MSIFRKAELLLGLTLLLAVLGLGGWSWLQSKRIDKLQSDKETATADASAHETYVTEQKKLVVKEKAADERMDQALEANPEWSGTVVPNDVARELCHSPDAACNLPR